MLELHCKDHYDICRRQQLRFTDWLTIHHAAAPIEFASHQLQCLSAQAAMSNKEKLTQIERHQEGEQFSFVYIILRYTTAVMVDNRIYRLASQYSRRCEMQRGPLLRSAGKSCWCGTRRKLHQQLMVLSGLSSCTMPLHWFPVIPLQENVFPETVLPVVHLPLLQKSQIATPELCVKVLPEMLRPKVGPRLFCVFIPGKPSMLF